jgi:predicted transcriptional regulator
LNLRIDRKAGIVAEDNDKLRELVAEVAAAYFSNSHVGVSDIPNVVNQIAASLSGVGGPAGEAEPAEAPAAAPARLTPAQVRKSITEDGLISFEDGRRYKTLKRHLAVRGLTPAEYREKWGLPRDYPLVAASYSAKRSALAKTLGLGQGGRQPAKAAAAKPAATAKPARKPRAAKA